MILDMRKKVIPPGYAGHVPCRTEAFGLPEGKALQLSVATYELFQHVKKKPPLAKKDIRGFTSSIAESNVSGDLSKGGNIGSSSILIQTQQERNQEKFFHTRNTQSQANIEPVHGGSATFSLLMPSSSLQSNGQLQNFSTAFNPTTTAVHDSETMLYKLEKRIQRGNRSRDAASWIGGTSPHNIRLQRITGYAGF